MLFFCADFPGNTDKLHGRSTGGRSCLAKRMECVELAPAFEPRHTSDSGSKLHALHTLRAVWFRLCRPGDRRALPVPLSLRPHQSAIGAIGLLCGIYSITPCSTRAMGPPLNLFPTGGRTIALAAIFGCLATWTEISSAQSSTTSQVTNEIRIADLQGKVEVSPAGATTWVLTQTNQLLHPSDRLRTGPNSRVALRWSDH